MTKSNERRPTQAAEAQAKETIEEEAAAEEPIEEEAAEEVIEEEEAVEEPVEPLPFVQIFPVKTTLSRIKEGGYFNIGNDLYQLITKNEMLVAKIRLVPGGVEEIVRFVFGPGTSCKVVQLVIL